MEIWTSMHLIALVSNQPFRVHWTENPNLGLQLSICSSFFLSFLSELTNYCTWTCWWWCWWGWRLEIFYLNAKVLKPENLRISYNCFWWWWWWGRLRKFHPNVKVLPELTKVPLSPLHRIHFLTLSHIISHHFLLFTSKEIGQFYFFHFSKEERRETCECKSVCQLSQLAAKGKKLNAAHALILCQVCNGGRKTTE